jgi:histidyl-tRNA synthetase
MSKKDEPVRPEVRLPKGLFDTPANELRATANMLAKIKVVFERYGFEPLDTPAIEYTDALGKFLPDQDRPNEGVFSFKDDDEQWLSLRYDLTAPLARYVAENFQNLPKPFRRYQVGPVWRNEKPGPGRFRQFTQFDADTVGASSAAADAELCMLAADTLEALGAGGNYSVRVCHRKILDGVLESAGVPEGPTRLVVLRAIDKLDRLGLEGVKPLLSKGRRDDSGDFTKGAELPTKVIEKLMIFLEVARMGALATMHAFDTGLVTMAMSGEQGVRDVDEFAKLILAAGYDDRVKMDFSIVRGLEYYTGPVFEAEITAKVKSESGQMVRLGSVAAGGRYDGLVERFTGEKVPATGLSIGVSRLLYGLKTLGKLPAESVQGPVVVLVLDRDRIADYQKMAQTLRNANIRAELYLGESGMKAQMKYADKRGSPCVVIQGGDEKAKAEVQIKDLILGATLTSIKDRDDYLKKQAEAQFAVKENELVAAVQRVLTRHRS